MSAFGFDLSGYQGTENSTGGFTAALFNGSSQVDSVFVADTASFSVHFRGITSTIPFDAIRFTFSSLSPSNSVDILAFDEIDFNQIPEPTGLALIGLATGALLRRRPAV
jgi:hypothetical protein